MTVAILASGLRDNSRIKMKLAGLKVENPLLLLAYAVDRLGILIWQQTKDGMKNRNKPESLADKLLGISDQDSKIHRVTAFNSAEDFETARELLLKRMEGDDQS